MKLFLLDLWHDLRVKRLWPVAIALVAGLVAVPMVLSKSPEAPPPPPAEAAKPAPSEREAMKALAAVKLGDADEARGSSLSNFDRSDPFRLPKALARRAQRDSEAASTILNQLATGGSADGAGSTGGGGDTGSSGGGDTGSSGGDTGSAGGGETPDTTTTKQYSYVVDLTFKANGRTRRIKGMQRLDLLPSEASPLLLFMGVSSNAGNAVFLVDSTLEAAGEGRCKPKASNCAFLYLGPGSEHEFTNDDGDSYTLRIDEIRKVELGATASASQASASLTTPKITRVAPMRVSVGALLTIRGRNFKPQRVRNTVIFRAPNGRAAFAKPRSATRTKLVLSVPAAVSRLLNVSGPTRLRLRVLSGRFSSFTPRRLSPVVTGAGGGDEAAGSTSR